jgi:hypothetical protein
MQMAVKWWLIPTKGSGEGRCEETTGETNHSKPQSWSSQVFDWESFHQTAE